MGQEMGTVKEGISGLKSVSNESAVGRTIISIQIHNVQSFNDQIEAKSRGPLTSGRNSGATASNSWRSPSPSFSSCSLSPW